LDLISVNRKLWKHSQGLYGLYCSLICYTDDQLKEDEMGGACGTHGREEKCLKEFGGESLEDQGVDVRKVLSGFFNATTFPYRFCGPPSW
jgi:hypothetical protein